MMHILEHVSDETYKGFFVDLYVRCANMVAIHLYEGLGYSVYRRVKEYYGSMGLGKGVSDEEDAFGVLSYPSHMLLTISCRHAETSQPRSNATLGASKWTRHDCQCTRCILTLEAMDPQA
jgi:hypothetical protein